MYTGSVGRSVRPYLTSGASVRPENDITYSTDKEGQNICSKLLHWTSILETAHAHYLRFASTRGAEGYYARLAASVDGAHARTGKCASLKTIEPC